MIARFWSSAVLTGSPTDIWINQGEGVFWSSAVLTGSPTADRGD